MNQIIRYFTISIALALAFTSISADVGASADGSKRLVGVDDQFAIRNVGSPVFSPDGKWIAYTVSAGDFENNRTSVQIWMAPAGGGKAIPMTSAAFSSRNPVFSRDGDTLYFLSARHEQKSQLWSLNLQSGGEGQQVTDLERGVSQINFSSDEKKLLLVLKDEDDSEPLVEGSKPWVVDRLTFKADYTGYLDRLRNHIYIYDIPSKQLSQVTSGDFDNGQAAWSPDDSMIAFASNRDIDGTYNSDIWVVAAEAGAQPRRITSSKGEDRSPVWHPDGEWLAYVSKREGVAENYAVQHMTRIKIDDPEAEFLTDSIDRNISRLKFSEDGEQIYFVIEDSGESHVARMDWDAKTTERLIEGKLVVSSFAVSNDGRVAAIISSSLQPGELFVQDGNGLTRITAVNDELMGQLELARTEEIHFQAPDGWDIEGFVTYPAGFEAGRKYPTILRIHGGPVGQYSHAFSFESQLLAANGYLVVRTNPRGSSGYGEEFTLGLFQGWGEKDYRDVLAGVDHVIDQGYADPERLGVGGYSYGGILTNYLLGQTGRFKAAVSGAGSGLYIASYGHDEYRFWYESELGLPWENRELWERLSPFNHIHKATTPTLFIGGEKDWNVPIQGSEQLYQVMKRQGIETELVVYPGEFHGGWSFANRKDAWLRRLAWYGRYLKEEAASD